MCESSPFIWPSGPPSGCLSCCSLEWQPESPLALSLRLLVSAELCSSWPASPAWSSRELSDLRGLDQGDPLGLLQDVPWALGRNPLNPNYSRDTIIAIMELDWFCTGVLKVSHVCYLKGFCELLSWVSTKALVGLRCLTINNQANRVAIVSSVITRIFFTLCNAGRSHFNLYQYRHSRFIYLVHSIRLPVISCIILLLLFNLLYCCLIIHSSFIHLLFNFCFI